jgi:hypothetical protein
MKSWVQQWAWRSLYPVVRAWLEERALRLPRATRQWIAKRAGVEESVVEAIEADVREFVLHELERFQP